MRKRGRSLTRLLDQATDPAQVPSARALTREMVYGALRNLPRLEALSSRLLDHPMKAADQDVEALILIGLYQVVAMDTPDHAAVAATVEASRLLGKPHKAALVNAVLRRFLRERDRLLAEVDATPAARWLFPSWLLEQLRADWPEDWEDIVEISNSRAPLTLRINRTRTDRPSYLAMLAVAGLAARPLPDSDVGLTLDRPIATEELPGFGAGLVSVQDAGAQLAADLLDAAPGHRVLDACAAPGGKTAALLERAHNRLDLVAVDKAPGRLQSIHDTLRRLGLTAVVVRADASEPGGDWTSPPFDRILLDVPCSATGVIRRHPDIKWLRRPADIPALCAMQDRLLDAAWPLLAPGGALLYATCSLLSDENQHRVAAFLERHPEAREDPIEASWGRARGPGRQLLPSLGGNDGFYYARLAKPIP